MIHINYNYSTVNQNCQQQHVLQTCLLSSKSCSWK